MRRRPARRLLLLSLVCTAARATPCVAQAEASLDAAASLVKYDGYLSSGALALTPSVVWQSPRAALGARGTLLVFESGNTSVQGLLTAATFSPPLGRLRVEAAAEAGASAYDAFARFAHALGRVRVHALAGRWGAWAGPVAGRALRGTQALDVWGASAGGWVRAAPFAAGASLTHVRVRDTAYSDAEGRVQWRHRSFSVEGVAGTRFASTGGGHGVYADVSATARVSSWMTIVVAGGRYPSDPVRGSIPGGYVTLGTRLAPRPPPRSTVVRQLSRSLVPDAGDAPPRHGGVLIVVELSDGLAVLTVRAPGARRVEMMGDFTDWQPLALVDAGGGRHEFAVRLASGIHRFNVRVDGGAWDVPDGVDVSADEFGGRVGVLVVP